MWEIIYKLNKLLHNLYQNVHVIILKGGKSYTFQLQRQLSENHLDTN